MIGRIQGIIIDKSPPAMLVDVNGVGYEIQASMNTFYLLPELGQKISLHTHFIVREDQQALYGFMNLMERSVFRALIKVNGVGPKLAITILSSIEPQQLLLCVEQQDISTLVKLPGVGKKTAERLVIEMRDKIADLAASSRVGTLDLPHTKVMVQQSSAMQDAISALITLGYKPPEAQRAIKAVMSEGVNSSEDLIRAALRQLAA